MYVMFLVRIVLVKTMIRYEDFLLFFTKTEASRIYRDVLCQRFSHTSTVNQLKTPLHESDITEDNPSSVLYFAVSSELCRFFGFESEEK